MTGRAHMVAALTVVLLSLATLISGCRNVAAPATGPATHSETFRIYRSVDQGASWIAAGSGLPTSKRINALAVARSVAFAGTDDGVFISTDEGRTWSASALTPAPRVLCFTVEGPRVYAGSSAAGAFVTLDSGSSWRQVDRGLTDVNVRSLATLGLNIYAGTDSKGVFVLRGGETSWSPFGQGLPEHAQVFDLATKGRHLYAALYSNGLFRISTEGGGWERVGDVLPLEVVVHGDALIAGHNPGGIHRSTDDGRTWRAAGGLPAGPPIWVLGSAGPNVLAGTSPGSVVLSKDLGATWTPSASGLPPGSAVIATGDGEWYTLAAVVQAAGG